MKMNNKRRLLLGLLSILALSVWILYGCSSVIMTDPIEVIESNWEIKLPKNAREIFYESSDISFLGDGERYSVYECKDETTIINLFDWKDDKSKIIVSGFEEVIHKIRSYKDTEIHNEYVPDLTRDFFYFHKELEDNSKIYIIHIPGENKIYISEEIF